MPDAALRRPDLSLLDSLTGLPNRRALMAVLRDRVPAGQGSLVLLDLDHFREASRNLPRKEVDRIVLEVAGRFRGALSPDAVIFRYAGDAFCAVQSDPDRDRAAAMAENLRSALTRTPFTLGEPATTQTYIPITASAAVAAFPMDGRSAPLVVEAAEVALFVAKHEGRNRTAVAGRLDPNSLAEIGVYRGLPCPVLVGRVAEQTRLRQVASDVRHVGPTVALLSGAPGLGKSRLMRELSLWARAERFVVLSATCQEARAGLPYSTLAEQVQNLLTLDRNVALAALEKLQPAHRAALSVIVPDLPLLGPVPEVELSKYSQNIFDAFGALLDELSKGGSLFLAVDEVEHADWASLQALRAAVHRRVPLFLVAATDWETGGLDRTPAGELLRDRALTGVLSVPLGPLSTDDMRKMFQAILPEAEVASGAAEQLLSAARGNPLYVEETVRSLLLRGRIRLVAGRWSVPKLEPDDLPHDTEGALAAVAKAIPARADSLLTGAAVLGSQFDPELLQEVLGQEEMEMVDLLDEARRARLVVASDSGTDLLTFPAAHARRVRLASSAEHVRKEIHGRLGVVQEARHGGDASHLADELAFHYGRAGNAPRARHFEGIARRRAALIEPPRPEGSRRARLETIKEALSSAAQEHALAMMRHFCAAIKVGRLYPQSSQVAAGFVTQLRQEFEALLSRAGAGFTFASTAEGPTLNGVKCDAGVAADFAALLEERLIESMTVLRSFNPARLEALVGAFMERIDRVRATPDLWERFLERERLEALDLVQKAYQARSGEKLVRQENPLPPEVLPALRDLLRHLKAAADNLRLYPPGHFLVKESAAQATSSLTGFVRCVPAVTLGTAEGELVVNGQPGDRKFFGDAGVFMVLQIDRRDLKSITLKEGLQEEEALGLIQILALPADDPAGAAIVAKLVHVEFGAREYERAEEGAEEVALAPPPKPLRSELRARKLLAESYDKFLSSDLDDQFSVLVEALAYGAGRPVAEELLDRLGSHFHDIDLDHRVKAFTLLSRLLAFASPTTRKVGVVRSAPPLKQRLQEDMDPNYFCAASDVLPFWIPAAATVGCLREVAEVAGPTLRKRADASETPPDIASLCRENLQRISESGVYPVIQAAVQKPKQDERVAAVSILIAVGGQALQRLLEILIDEPNLAARRQIAMALGLQGPRMAEELAKVLDGKVSLDRLGRILEVAEPLMAPPLLARLGELAEGGSPEIQKEILQAAAQWTPERSAAILRKLIGSPQVAQRDKGIALATQMRLGEVAADLARLLQSTTDERLMAACSDYFAEAPSAVAVPILMKIAARRPRWFGLVKGYAPQTRAAAVRALQRQGSKQAEEAAHQAEHDPAVRALVRQ